MAVTEVGTPNAPTVSSGTNSVSCSPTWSGSQPRTAGDYLVAVCVNWGGTTGGTPGTPTGWTQALTITSNSRSVVTYFVKIAAGSDAAPTISATNTGTATFSTLAVQLHQLTGQDMMIPLAITATATGTTANPLVATTAANVPQSGCFALGAASLATSTNITSTLGAGSGWTDVADNGSTNTRAHWVFSSQSNPTAQAQLSESFSYTGTGAFLGAALLVVQPAGSMTVTATPSTSATAAMLKVFVITSATEAGGAHASSGPPGNASITPNFSNSLPVWVAQDFFGHNAFTSVNANNTISEQFSLGVGAEMADGYYSGTVTSGTAITVGAVSADGSSSADLAIYEVPSSGGSATLDGSTQPGTSENSSHAALTSYPVVPPAGAVLAAVVSSYSAPTQFSIADSMGLTWTRRDGGSGTSGATAIYTATIPSTGMRVTFGGSGGFVGTGSVNAAPKLRVLLFENAAAPASQNGGTASTAAAYQASVTIAATGSAVAVSTVAGPSTTSLTADTLSTALDNIQDSTNNQRHGSFISTALTSATGAATYGSSTAFATDGVTVAAEIKASGGTLTRDTANEPAVVTSTTANAVTSATFVPTAGDLIVALVDGLCTGGKVADSSGLTWTMVKQLGTDGYVGIFIAQVPGGGSVSGSASLSGSGTLIAGAQFAAAVALSGAGTLTPAPQFAVTVALSGSGLLTSAPVFSAAAALSGTGTLTAAETIALVAALSGQGTLSAGGRFSGAAVLSGAGTLSAAGVLAAAAALTGSGTLAASPLFAAVAALSGSGTLSAAETIRTVAALSGSGTLSAALTIATAVALSGSGTLSAAETIATAVAMSGSGTLTASWSASGQAAATLSGSGTLGVTVGWLASAALSGSGILGASPRFASAAALSGQGTLASAGKFAGAVLLSGAGTLGAAAVLTAAVSMSGSGLLTASSRFKPAAALSGQGTLLGAARLAGAVLLSGSGTLNGSPGGGTAGAAALSGSGTLTAQARLAAAVVLSGSGVLTGTPVIPFPPGLVALSGFGVLTALPTMAAPSADALWLVFERLAAISQREGILYRETVIAGGRGWAGPQYTRAYEAEQAADLAYAAWQQATGNSPPT